jgi:hypothetical protein
VTEKVTECLLKGSGLMSWAGSGHGVETRYSVRVGLDGTVKDVELQPRPPDYLRGNPAKGKDVFLLMDDGRRLTMTIDDDHPLGALSVIQCGSDATEWWLDITPWTPRNVWQTYTLTIKAANLQVYENHTNEASAFRAFNGWLKTDLVIEAAEIRMPGHRRRILK